MTKTKAVRVSLQLDPLLAVRIGVDGRRSARAVSSGIAFEATSGRRGKSVGSRRVRRRPAVLVDSA
ncbi:hypothetical protein OG266_01960 [Streptomyces sp. NBC_00554]|uniref:hypothetical protein n=1 Tax=Streptomyces sp. NBC_00554 TaxID=2903661 RepID=UPI00352FE6CF|nr:hypothetical protein OG266_01960 [Streptomyces sp. NBC_00554]